jgi:hypothetical protein
MWYRARAVTIADSTPFNSDRYLLRRSVKLKQSIQAKRKQNTAFHNSLVPRAINSSSNDLFQTELSDHIVHTRRRAAAEGAVVRRRREDARPRCNFAEGVAASTRPGVAGEEGLNPCCPASLVRKEEHCTCTPCALAARATGMLGSVAGPREGKMSGVAARAAGGNGQC